MQMALYLQFHKHVNIKKPFCLISLNLEKKHNEITPQGKNIDWKKRQS